MSGITNELHPRPDFNRGVDEGADWLSLDGEWEFGFEPSGQQAPPDGAKTDGYDRAIQVPYPWQSHLAWGTEALGSNENWYSKEALTDPASANETPRQHGNLPQYEVGWYRRQFTVPEGWSGKRVILNIGAADWHVTVWCNGERIGDADSGYVPVAFDLTGALTDGGNDLVIRVFDPMDHAQKPVGKQWDWYARTSGIWQPVWLEPRSEAHIGSVKITPNVEDGSVFVCAQAEGAGEGAQLRLEIGAPDGGITSAVLDWQDGWFTGTVPLGEAILWTPKTPELYDVTATLVVAGEDVDQVFSYFGMRTVGVGPLYEGGPEYVYLNGEPIYLCGALDQSFNPWGVYAWKDSDAAKRDVELAVEGGFNFLRIHIKLEDPRFLYWCDKLGILLQCDLPNWGYSGYSEIAKQRHEVMLRAAVERDFNHPCIFSWCLFNETWGLGDARDFQAYKKDRGRQEYVAGLYELAKQLDSTRLIEDQSPCHYDHVVSDINSWHFYINDYEQAKEHIANVVEQTYPGSEFNYVPGWQQANAPLMNSEYGGISAGMGDMDVSWCFRFLTTEMRKYEKICGYIYTELQDIEWEHNGFYDYDRRPKQFGYDPALLQRDVFVGFDCAPAITLGVGEQFTLPVFVSCMSVPDNGQVKVAFSGDGIDSLGEAFSVIDADWVMGGIDKPSVINTTIPDAADAEQAVPYAVDRPGLVRLNANVVAGGDAWNCVFLEVRDGRLPQVEKLADGRTVLRKLAGEFETSSAWHEAEVERGKVGEEQHLIAGVGSGHLDYRFEIPDGETPTKVTLLVEASSKRSGSPQTSDEKWPTDLKTYLNGVLVDERTLADQPSDTRGALSHMHGFHGRYGELIRLELSGEKLEEALAASDGLQVRLEVPADGCNRRGLTVYSSRAGSCPCDITLIVQ